jgi:hypothetical protein
MCTLTLAIAVAFTPSDLDRKEIGVHKWVVNINQRLFGLYVCGELSLQISEHLLRHSLHMYSRVLQQCAGFSLIIDRSMNLPAFGSVEPRVFSHTVRAPPCNTLVWNGDLTWCDGAVRTAVHRLTKWHHHKEYNLWRDARTLQQCVDAATTCLAMCVFQQQKQLARVEDAAAAAGSSGATASISTIAIEELGTVAALDSEAGSTSASVSGVATCAVPAVPVLQLAAAVTKEAGQNKRAASTSCSRLNDSDKRPKKSTGMVPVILASGLFNIPGTTCSGPEGPPLQSQSQSQSQTVEDGGPRPSPPAREEILAELDKSILQETGNYADHLRGTGMRTIKYFEDTGLPPNRDRRALLRAHAPTLWCAVNSAITSERFVNDCGRNQVQLKKISFGMDINQEKVAGTDAALSYRAEQKRSFSVAMLELIIGHSAGPSVLTPALVENGVLFLIGGMTQRAMTTACSRGLCCSFATAQRVLKGWNDRRCAEIAKLVKGTNGSLAIVLFIFDNYVPNQYRMDISIERGLTHSTPTISVLHTQLQQPCTDPTRTVGESLVPPSAPVVMAAASQVAVGAVAPTPPAFVRIDFEQLLAAVKGNGVNLPPELAVLKDPGYLYQGLRNFNVLPNLSGRSSSYRDTEEKVVKELLEQYAQMGKREVATLVDTEYELTLYLMAHCDPERYANLWLLFAPFHARMHLLNNLMTDPVMMVLWINPFYYGIGLQRQKAKESTAMILAAMKKDIAAHNAGTSGSSSVDNKGNNSAVQQSSSTPAAGTARGHGADYVERAMDMLLNDGEIVEEEDDGGAVDQDDDGEDDWEPEEDDDAQQHREVEMMHSDAEATCNVRVVQEWLNTGARENGKLFKHKDMKARLKNLAREIRIGQKLAACLPIIRATVAADILRNLPWCAFTMMDQIHNGISGLAIKPFQEMILQGSPAKMVNTMHSMMKYLAHCRRDKVVRSLAGTMMSMLNMRNKRPDLYRVYASNCCKVNDNHIENHNSQIQRCLPGNSELTPEMVSDAACFSQMKRILMDNFASADGLNPASVTEGKPAAGGTSASDVGSGEVYREEVRHLNTRGQQETQSYARVLTTLLKQLIAAGQAVEDPDSSVCTTMEECEAHGAQLIESTHFPQYKGYLAAKLKKHDADRQYATMGTTEKRRVDEEKYVNEHVAPALEGFLMAAGDLPAGKPAKSVLVQRILQRHTVSEFNAHLIQYNVGNPGKAKDFLARLLHHKHVLQRQAVLARTSGRFSGFGGNQADSDEA